MKLNSLTQGFGARTPQEALALFPDMSTVQRKLEAYAQRKIREATRNKLLAVDARLPEDFVQAAILKFLTGDRKWNPQKCPSLFQFLKGIVRSDLSDAFRKASRIDPFVNTSESLPEPVLRSGFPAGPDVWEPEVIWQRVEAEVQERSDSVLSECWHGFQQDKRPREISEDAGIPIHVVYNGQRRLASLFRGVGTAYGSPG